MFVTRTPTRVPCLYCQQAISRRSYVRQIKLPTPSTEPGLPRKRGPPKGKVRDPSDPSKIVSRATLINFKPRGPTKERAVDKTESDTTGKIVHEEVHLDVNGTPEKIPKLFWMRVPLLRSEPNSYLDWKRRRAGLPKLLEGTEMEIKQIELEVDRITWEKGLRERPPPTTHEFALNAKIIDILRELRDRALRSDTPFKARSYEMAIRSIEVHPTPIKSGQEAMLLPGVGPKTAEKIQEIIDTGTLKRLEDDTVDKKAEAVALFTRVSGIGPVAAQEFVDRGLLTLDDLRKQPDLTFQQIVGLKYFKELEVKISREEMDIWNATIQTAAEAVDSDFQCTLVGQYRRGVHNCQVIDVLLAHPDYTSEQPSQSLLNGIIAKLQLTGYITDHLSTSPSNYLGVVQLPSSIFSSSESESRPLHRRLCLRLVPWDSFVYSQLHYTGSEAFILHVREQAAKMGYRLCMKKLEKRKETTVEVFGVDALRFVQQDKNDERDEGECVLLDSEEDIFRFLKMRYIPPHSRNWY